MSFDIRYLPLAEDDIDRLAGYLTWFYPHTAQRVLGEMEERLAQLRDFPEMCEEYQPDSFFRKLVVDDYVLFYHVNDVLHTVDVYRVLRGSWNLKHYLSNTAHGE